MNGYNRSQPASAKPQAADPLPFLVLLRLHLVLDRLLGRRDHFGRASLGLDLFVGGLRKVMRLDDQFLGDVARAQNAHAVGGAVGEADALERLGRDGVAVVERLIDIADVNYVKFLIPGFVGEPSLGDTAEKRHLAAFEGEARILGAGSRVLALGAARGGLAMPAARSTADALFSWALGDAVMYG